MELEKILESIDQDIFTEEAKGQIKEAFELAVETRATEKADLAVESALIDLDEEHAEKLDRFVEAIDRDHVAKLNQVVVALDEDRAGKLKSVITKYERDLDKKASDEMEQLTDSIDAFLESYLDDVIPSEVIQEAAKNTHAQRLMEEAREVLSIDEKFANGVVKEAVEDGAKKLKALKAENVKLRKVALATRSTEIVEAKTSSMPTPQANFIKKRFTGKSPKFINENFDYVVELWESRQSNDGAINHQRQISPVDRQPLVEGEFVTEHTDEVVDPAMNLYLEGMTR